MLTSRNSETYLHILDLFARAYSLVADLLISTVGTICPGEMPSHAHQVTIGLPCAPQASTWWLHKWTGFGALAERQLTLTVEVIGCPWHHVR